MGTQAGMYAALMHPVCKGALVQYTQGGFCAVLSVSKAACADELVSARLAATLAHVLRQTGSVGAGRSGRVVPRA